MSGTGSGRAADSTTLRSMREVTAYRIAARDGEIGHVNDCLVGEPEWAIQYLVVDTRSWWIGKKVVIPPEAIRDVRWADSTVELALGREEIRASAEYAPDGP